MIADGGLDEARDAHLDYFVEWAEEWERRSWRDELGWKLALEQELPNLRSAVRRSFEVGDTDLALRLTHAVRRSTSYFFLFEVADWALDALELDGVDVHPLGPQVAGLAAWLCWARRDRSAAIELVDRALAMPAYDATTGFPALIHATIEFYVNGSKEKAFRILRSAEADGPISNPSTRIHWDPSGTHVQTDLAALRDFADRTGSLLARSAADGCDALLLRHRGELHRSAALSRSSMAAAIDLGLPLGVQIGLANLALTAGALGELTPSDIQSIRGSLKQGRDAGERLNTWLVLGAAARRPGTARTRIDRGADRRWTPDLAVRRHLRPIDRTGGRRDGVQSRTRGRLGRHADRAGATRRRGDRCPRRSAEQYRQTPPMTR